MSGDTVEISVLGAVTVRTDDGIVDLGPRLKRLLAALAVRHGQVVSTDHLIEVVWMDEPPAGAERTLKSYVTRLRGTIDPQRRGVIAFRGAGYVLELPEGGLDSDRFDAELDEARGRLRAGEDEAALLLLENGLDRWSGAAYAGFADEEWARPAAVRLEERRLEALETRIELQLSSANSEQAVAESRALVEAEPLRERSRALLMRAYYSAGRQAEALRVFRQYRTMLVDEVGLDPSQELVDLEARIARRDASLAGAVRALRGYELGERIGEGAFAVVRRAVQPGVDRDVAIKIIRAELADQPDFIRRFEHEAQIIASVEHPHVVPLYDYWREPGAAYLVMRYLRGGTVEQALRTSGPYSRSTTLSLLEDIGGALAAAHRAGVIHRDIRPANLLLDGDGATYLADFGIALPPGESGTAVVASPAHASPELLRNEAGGVPSDVLSLAVTVFELLTGRLPFSGSVDQAELVRRQLAEPLPSVRSTRTDLPAAIDEVLARATAKAAADRHQSVEALVADIAAALDESGGPTGTGSPLVALQGDVTNPFVGIHAFDEPDAARFFGREGLTVELVELVERQPLVVVVGPSGSGKSSVVRAGVIPAIRHGAVPGSDRWFIASMVPGIDAIASLETSLLRIAVNPPSSLREQLAEDGGLLRAVKRVLPDDRSKVLLFVDQFEELFTLSESDDAQRRFLSELAAAIAAADSPLRVIATLRADHYDAPLRHPAMADLVTAGTVTVRPMSPAEIERAVVQPASGVGVDVEPALVAELVGEVTGQPATLPLLQFALTEVFERRVAGVMQLSSYESIGGFSGALAARADRIMCDGDPGDEREVRRIFGRLVVPGSDAATSAGGTTPADVRRRALRSEFGKGERTAWLLDAFVVARLLTIDRDATTREPTVEVAHEALLRDWPSLRKWLEEDRQDLDELGVVRSSARAWAVADYDDGELGRGARLETASALATRRPDLLTAEESMWVNASTARWQDDRKAEIESQERERRQNRRLSRLLVATVVLLVLALGAAGGAIVLRNRAAASERAAVEAREVALIERTAAETAEAVAEDERAAADDERSSAVAARENADIERLIAVSAAQASVAPDRAILLALEANRRRDNTATQTAVHRSIAGEPRRLSIFPFRLSAEEEVVFSRDGLIGLAYTSTALEFFETSTGEGLGTTETGEGIRFAWLSGDGTAAAVVSTENRVDLIDHSGARTQVPVPNGYVVQAVTVDRAGERVLLQSPENLSVVVDVTTGGEVGRYETAAFAGSGFSFLSDDGRSFLNTYQVAADQQEGQFADLVSADGQLLSRGQASSRAIEANTSGDGRFVIGAEEGGVFVVSDPSVEGVRMEGGGLLDQRQVAIGEDLVVAADDDGVVRFWAPSGESIGSPLAVGGEVAKLGPRADGTVAVAVRGQGHQIVSPTEPVVLSGRHAAVGYSQVVTGADRFEATRPGATEVVLRSLENGDVVRSVDQPVLGPGGVAGEPFFSSDGASFFSYGSAVAITSVESGTQQPIDLAAVYTDVYGAVPEASPFLAIRPEGDGERTFLRISGPPPSPQAVWIDTATSKVAAGPLALVGLDQNGPVLTLADGRVVVSGLAILPRDLDGPPVVVADGDGLKPLHEDPSTGLVLVASDTGEVGVLDPDTATLRQFENGPTSLYAGGFSPDGMRAAVASQVSGVQIYDTSSGRRLGVPVEIQVSGEQLRLDGVGGRYGRGLRWSADGRGIWTAPVGGPVEFAATPESWREIACEIVNRELTANEWRSFVSETEPQVSSCT